MKKRIVQIKELEQELKDKRQVRHGIRDVAKTAIKAAAARIEGLEQSVEELCRQRKEADEAMRRIRQAAKELIDKLARFNLLCPETLALKAALAYGPETTALINELKRQKATHDATKVAMAAASRCDALNAELIEQRDAERQTRQEEARAALANAEPMRVGLD